MDVELSVALGGGLGAGVALAATPIAIRVAGRTGFYDRPRQYRQHAAATPFLGGAAVLVAFLIAALAVGGASGARWPLLAGAFAMWVVGTIDDLVAVPPGRRIAVEVGVAAGLFAAGLGWNIVGGAGPIDFVLTVLWIVAIVNAFNLMDNLDGACGTVGCVSAAGIGTLAAISGQAALAGMAFALAAACAAFLRWNLSGPARIFLGDGGSMPVGFLVAGLGMATSRNLGLGDAGLLAIALTAGLVILDTTLVVVSRRRRGISVTTGGRDHLTHRLLARLHSPRAVALVLALTQVALCGLAVGGDELGATALAAFAAGIVACGLAAIVVLDSAASRPTSVAKAKPFSGRRAIGSEPEPMGLELP
jgi:UDP-GlcNAc:undecaprenyl-phosphate GlcNAc-1-phosphate transferase